MRVHHNTIRVELTRSPQIAIIVVRVLHKALERARKRAKFRVPEHVEFVGNWESGDGDVERKVVELN
jgi:hypothetical protein